MDYKETVRRCLTRIAEHQNTLSIATSQDVIIINVFIPNGTHKSVLGNAKAFEICRS